MVQISLNVQHAWINFENSKKIDEYVHDRTLMDDTIRKLAWEGLQKNIVFDDEAMIDKRTGKVLDPEVDSRYYKTNFKG